MRVYPGDLGTAAGFVTDRHARVLDREGQPIPGLYACGNDMNSVMGGTYPGPGITLGPALTFGYLAGCDLAGKSQDPRSSGAHRRVSARLEQNLGVRGALKLVKHL